MGSFSWHCKYFKIRWKKSYTKPYHAQGFFIKRGTYKMPGANNNMTPDRSFVLTAPKHEHFTVRIPAEFFEHFLSNWMTASAIMITCARELMTKWKASECNLLYALYYSIECTRHVYILICWRTLLSKRVCLQVNNQINQWGKKFWLHLTLFILQVIHVSSDVNSNIYTWQLSGKLHPMLRFHSCDSISESRPPCITIQYTLVVLT